MRANQKIIVRRIGNEFSDWQANPNTGKKSLFIVLLSTYGGFSTFFSLDPSIRNASRASVGCLATKSKIGIQKSSELVRTLKSSRHFESGLPNACPLSRSIKPHPQNRSQTLLPSANELDCIKSGLADWQQTISHQDCWFLHTSCLQTLCINSYHTTDENESGPSFHRMRRSEGLNLKQSKAWDW